MTTELPSVDVHHFHDVELEGILRGERAAFAAPAAAGLGPLVITVGPRSWTYRASENGLEVIEGTADDASVAITLSAETWSDLAAGIQSVMPLYFSREITITKGSIKDLGPWEVVLRALYLGMQPYAPELVALVDEAGEPLDLSASFTIDDDVDELAQWLAVTGFLHLKNVLSAEEVKELADEVARLEGEAGRDDPHTWWATRADGTEELCRIVYAHERSALIERLVTDPRLERLGRLLGQPLASFPDRMHGPTLVLKPAGELAGRSNLPWHQDCWFGAHPITCPSLGIGIQISGSTAATSRLEVIAGSHGRSVSPAIADVLMEGWPKVCIDTDPGDVTVHLHDILHASPAPTGEGGRATLYLWYYTPTLGDFVQAGEEVPSMIRRLRPEGAGQQ